MFKNKLEILMKSAKNTCEAMHVLSLVENCSNYVKTKADIQVRSMFLDATYGEENVTSKQYMEFIGPYERELQQAEFSIALEMGRMNKQSMALVGEEIFPNFHIRTIFEMYIKSISSEF